MYTYAYISRGISIMVALIPPLLLITCPMPQLTTWCDPSHWERTLSSEFVASLKVFCLYHFSHGYVSPTFRIIMNLSNNIFLFHQYICIYCIPYHREVPKGSKRANKNTSRPLRRLLHGGVLHPSSTRRSTWMQQPIGSSR